MTKAQDSTKRIDPAEVSQAYSDTGMVPATGSMHSPDENDENTHCGCALGVLYKQRTGFYHGEHADGRDTHDAYAWANQEYGAPYIDAFMLGFDSAPHLEPLHVASDLVMVAERGQRATHGYKDGRACSLTMFGKVKDDA